MTLAHGAAGRFVLTLCRLTSPASIPLPEAPELRRYKLFTRRWRPQPGREQRVLHMGYFATLAEAERCLGLMRGMYPNAIVNRQAVMPSNELDSTVIPLQAGARDSRSLTDTEVLRVLETRQSANHDGAAVPGGDISLIRPEDTHTRLALKEAVVQNVPVSFAVQLQWSVQPIELARVPSLDIFRAYTLYLAEVHRDRRSWYSLRLGFFKDVTSAKQVGHYVRQQFASVAIVPITAEEQARGSNARIPPAALASLFAAERASGEP